MVMAQPARAARHARDRARSSHALFVAIGMGAMAIAVPASAQGPEPGAIAPLEAPVASGPVVAAAPASPSAADDDHDSALRVMGELGASLATILALAGVGAVIGSGAGSCDPDELFCSSPILEIFSGMLVGGILGAVFAPLSVTAAGDAIGGRGEMAGAWVGWLVGVASGALTAGIGVLAWSVLDGGPGNVALITSISLGAVMVIAGPLIGYEITHGRARGLAVAPTFGFDGRSGTLGVVGSF